MKPLVKAIWNDAQDYARMWVDEEDAEAFGHESCEIISVGFLISKTEKYITLAADWDETDKDYGRVTKIPSSMLISIIELHDSLPTEPHKLPDPT